MSIAFHPDIIDNEMSLGLLDTEDWREDHSVKSNELELIPLHKYL